MNRLTTTLAGCALLAGFAATALPARAAFSYLSPSQTQAKQCRDLQAAGKPAESLPICVAAAATFKQLGDAQKRNPWYAYEVEGQMLEAAALDYAALKRHREAYQTALSAHQLLLYIYKSYKMDDSDYSDIAAMTARLARFETAQRALL